MSDDEKAAAFLVLAAQIANHVDRKGEKTGLDPSERCLVLAQALALMIGAYGRTGRLQEIAADMAEIVATFPPIAQDVPNNEVMH